MKTGVSAYDLKFDLGSTSLDSLNLLYKQKLGSSWQEFDISIKDLALESVAGLISETQVVSANIVDHLQNDTSTGNISSLGMGRSSSGFHLSAYLEDWYMPPYGGIPGVKELDGYLELNEANGLFHIADNDGFEMFFPRNFKDYTVLHKAQGTIYFDWQSPDQSVIYSDLINTTIEAGDSQLKFSMIRPKGVKKHLIIIY